MANREDLKSNRRERRIADEIQHRMIAAISESKILRDKAVFKGGTMLRVCMFAMYRLSEDLDFSLLGISREDFYEEIVRIVNALSSAEIYLYMMETSLEGDRFIEWYAGTESGLILVEGYPMEEFAANGKIWLPINRNYSHIHSTSNVLCADLLHVAASKYNCVGNRHKGRDIYDMAYMIDEGILPNAWEVYKKHHNDFYYETTTPENVIEKMNSDKNYFEDAWNKDYAKGYFPDGIDFSETYDTLVDYLNSFWYE